jgi:hypothetical protein
MSGAAPRPWIDLYRDVPPTIQPRSRTGLDMFRARAHGRGDAPLMYYFDQPVSVELCDTLSDGLAVGLQKRGVETGEGGPSTCRTSRRVIAVLALEMQRSRRAAIRCCMTRIYQGAGGVSTVR